MTHDAPEHRGRPARPDAADPLASRLQAWRRRQDATRDHDALAARIGAAIRGDAAIAPAPRPHGPWIERLAWFTAGLAAALVVAWLSWPARHSDAPPDWPPSVRFAAGQLAEKTALVAGMEATFGDELAWIAEHDQRVDVGLVPDGPGDGGPVAVRIVVLTRRAGEAAWQPAWRSDVVARNEQVVDVATGPGGTGRLRLWAHALPDGAYAIDGELTLAEAGVPLEASYSGVQRPGEPRRVTGDRTSDVEWQIIQTVVPLAAGGRPQDEVG
jgi:hypothetical protein